VTSGGLPLLRSPPYPGVRTDVAAISAFTISPMPSPDDNLEAVVTAIREARVGGSFWAPSPPVPSEPAIVVRAERQRDVVASLRRFAAERDRLIILVPKTRWARKAQAACRRAGVATARGDVDPWPLLVHARLLLAHPGDEWLLLATILRVPAETLAEPLPLPDLQHALLGSVRYRDPYDGGVADALKAVAQLAFWRHLLDANRAIGAAAGISWWKRGRIAAFLWTGRRTPLRFTHDAAKAVRAAKKEGGGVAVWPARTPQRLREEATAAGVPVARIEDGFVRSIGLGSNFHLPYSIVVDSRGVYFDPSGPSDLETLLAETDFTPDLLTRAERLALALVANRISKYGVAEANDSWPQRSGRKLVLVAGQVEDDLSVATGGAGVAGNLDLLRRARAAEPDAEIWFRPHPDVEAGHRIGRVADEEALAYADHVVRGGTAIAAVEQVDAVHVLTSLIGFEALLRGKPVVTHGQPFYAGWGLTTDLAPPVARRGRPLALAALIAGALILYPRYLDPSTDLPCPPEVLLARFATGARPRMTPLILLRTLQGRIARRLSR